MILIKFLIVRLEAAFFNPSHHFVLKVLSSEGKTIETSSMTIGLSMLICEEHNFFERLQNPKE